MASKFTFAGFLDVSAHSELSTQARWGHGAKIDFGDNYVGVCTGLMYGANPPISAPATIQLWKLTPVEPEFKGEFSFTMNFGGASFGATSRIIHHAKLTKTKAICLAYEGSGTQNVAVVVERVGEALEFGPPEFYLGEEDTFYPSADGPGANDGFFDPDNPVGGSNRDSAYLAGSCMVLANSETSAVIASSCGWLDAPETFGIATRKVNISGRVITRVKKEGVPDPVPNPAGYHETFTPVTGAPKVVGPLNGQLVANDDGGTYEWEALPLSVNSEPIQVISNSLGAGRAPVTTPGVEAYANVKTALYSGSYGIITDWTISAFRDTAQVMTNGQDFNGWIADFFIPETGPCWFSIRRNSASVVGGFVVPRTGGFALLNQGTHRIIMNVDGNKVDAEVQSPFGQSFFLSYTYPDGDPKDGTTGFGVTGTGVQLTSIEVTPIQPVKAEGGWHLNPSTGAFFQPNEYGWIYGSCVIGDFGFVLGWDWKQMWSVHRIDLATGLVTNSIRPVGESPTGDYYAGAMVALNGKLIVAINDWADSSRIIVKSFDPATLAELSAYEVVSQPGGFDRAFAQDWLSFENPTSSFQGGLPWVFFRPTSVPSAGTQEIGNGPTIFGPMGILDTLDYEATANEAHWDEGCAVVNDLYVIGSSDSTSFFSGLQQELGVFYRSKPIPVLKSGPGVARVHFE